MGTRFGGRNTNMRANEFISESTLKHKVADEDYDPNGPPPGPEFKPTMPKGTVRVDVSDVYDWYKLGQHISNMKGLGKQDNKKTAEYRGFGKQLITWCILDHKGYWRVLLLLVFLYNGNYINCSILLIRMQQHKKDVYKKEIWKKSPNCG
jgi:hypothetical protein